MNRALVLLAIAAANTGIAQRIVEPMLPALARDFASSVPAMGGVITGFAFAQAGAQYFHGPLGDRFGKLRVVTILMLLAGIASIGCAFAGSREALIAWRFATGLFSSATMTLGMAYLADVVPADRRQPILARFISGTITGQAFGPLIGGVLTDTVGWRASFALLGGIFAVVAVALYAVTRKEWGPPGRADRALFSPAPHISVLKRSPARWVLTTVFLELLFFYGAFSFLGALLRERFELPFSLIGLLLAGFGLGGLAYTLAVRWLLGTLGQRGCVLAGGLLGGVFIIAAVFAPAWPLVMICTMGLGFSFYMLHNTVQTKATEMAPQARATALSLFSMSWAGGQAVGAAVMAGGAALFGYEPMIVAFGLLFASLGVFLHTRLHRL